MISTKLSMHTDKIATRVDEQSERLRANLAVDI